MEPAAQGKRRRVVWGGIAGVELVLGVLALATGALFIGSMLMLTSMAFAMAGRSAA